MKLALTALASRQGTGIRMVNRSTRGLTVGFAVVMLVVAVLPGRSRGDERTHAFKLSIAGRMNVTEQASNIKQETDTMVRYAWRNSPREKVLTIDSFHVMAKSDGREMINMLMNRNEMLDSKLKGKSLSPEAQRRMDQLLQGMFGSPLCTIHLDENGNETRREIPDGPGPKILTENGMIANALLFHPPYKPRADKWDAEAQISMGNGAFAKGRLSYEKVQKDGPRRVVSVSGTLINESSTQPRSTQGIKAARYVVSGNETYDEALQEWTAGKLKMELSFQVTDNGTVIGTCRGTMQLDFEIDDKR
jgi:hypothetical protein